MKTAGLTHEHSMKIANNFEVTTTKPLDVRLVVDAYENLLDGSIRAPYKGMVVNIAGTRDIYILSKDGIKESQDPKNWWKVSGVEVMSREDFESPERMGELLHNPPEGLIVNIKGTDELYILIDIREDPNDWDDLWFTDTHSGCWLRIGGITEEYSIPILTDDLRQQADEDKRNHFNYDDDTPVKERDFYIILDKSKSKESVERLNAVEIVTTEIF